MERFDELWDPKDKDKLKKKFDDKEEDIPCNIWGYVQELYEKIEDIIKRIEKLEK